MVNATPTVGTDSPFFEFPARAYLEKYYSHVGDENAAFMRSITDYLCTRSVATDTVIEVAGGPCLYSLMALMACRERPFRHVTFTDIGWKNLREVEGWLHDYPQQFDYHPLLSWLQDEVGADPQRITSSLRSSTWELANFDWREPVPASWQRPTTSFRATSSRSLRPTTRPSSWTSCANSARQARRPRFAELSL